MSSVPVLIAILLAATFPALRIVDVAGAFIVAGLLFRASIKMVVEPWHKLMDGGMPAREQERIETAAKRTDGVKGVRQLRTRFISAYGLQVDCDILVNSQLTVERGHRIAEEVGRNIQAGCPNVHDVIVHVEPWPDKEGR